MIEVKDKSECCGCTACESVCSKQAIIMNVDSEGFKYPTVKTDLCVDCGLCNKVCPIEYREKKQENSHYKELLALRNTNNDEYMMSSSGGFVSIISDYVLKKEGVVFGVTYNDNMEVIHTYAENYEDCCKFRGSKYVQSNIDGIYRKVKEFLHSKRLVLFTGTPCQVEGLKLYLRKPYENLITVDLICHAVPSPLIFKEYISYIAKLAGEKVVDIKMRYKGGRGWGHKFSYLYVFESGRTEIDWPLIRDWGRLYFRNVITRPSCHKCKYCNFDRPGDFSVADYWDDNNLRPDIYSKDGTSLVIVNSEQALCIKEYLTDKFVAWNLTEDEAMQPCLQAPTPCNEKVKNEYWDYYYNHGFEKYYKRFFTDSFYIKRKMVLSNVKRMIKNFI